MHRTWATENRKLQLTNDRTEREQESLSISVYTWAWQ